MQLGHLIFADIKDLLPFTCDPDREEVAILLGARTTKGKIWVTRAIPVPNRADDPTRTFRVMKSDIPSEDLPHVVGVAHTHTSSNRGVSYYDVESLHGTNFFGLMYHHDTGAVKLYDATGWLDTMEWRMPV